MEFTWKLGESGGADGADGCGFFALKHCMASHRHGGTHEGLFVLVGLVVSACGLNCCQSV